MAEYLFGEMTADQAWNIAGTDTIHVQNGSAKRTSVIMHENGTYTVTVEGKTLTFGIALRDITLAANGLTFADGSRLFLGNISDNGFGVGSTQIPNVTYSGAVYAGAGADTVTSSAGDWLVQGNSGADRIMLERGRHTVYGGQGDDFVGLAAGAVNSFVQGNLGHDTMYGGAGPDTILGGQGNDSIHGRSAEDYLNGNLGNDIITGAGQLYGEGGDDTITSQSLQLSTVMGGSGNDVIMAGTQSAFGEYSQVAFGGEGDDTITSVGHHHDTLHGGDGNDVLKTLTKDGWVVVMTGGEGDDRLISGSGFDTLSGDAGNDTLGAVLGGSDLLQGGSGADRFVVSFSADPNFGATGTISDWSVEDRIELRGALELGYAEITAQSMTEALAMAQPLAASMNADLSSSAMGAIVAQIGSSLWVLPAYRGQIEGAAFQILNRSLSDISSDNFI